MSTWADRYALWQEAMEEFSSDSSADPFRSPNHAANYCSSDASSDSHSPASNTGDGFVRSSASPGSNQSGSRNTTPGSINASATGLGSQSKNREDEIDVLSITTNRVISAPDLVEYIHPTVRCLCQWDRNDPEQEYLYQFLPDDKQREEEVALHKARELAGLNGEIQDDGDDSDANSEAEWLAAMRIEESEQTSKTTDKEGTVDLAMDVAPHDDYDDEINALFDADSDEEMDTSSTALFAEPSLHENAISPPSLSCGESQVSQGTAVSIPSLDTPSPHALGSSPAPESSGNTDDELCFADDLEADLFAALEEELAQDEHCATYKDDRAQEDPATRALSGVNSDKTSFRSAGESTIEDSHVRRTEVQSSKFSIADVLNKLYSHGKDTGSKMAVNIVNLADDRRNQKKPWVKCRNTARRKRTRRTSRKARGKGPPVRRPADLPKMYHHFWHTGPDFKVLAQHVVLHSKMELKTCYLSLGLDPLRGQAMVDKIKQHLKTPGNSIRLSDDRVDEWKLKMAEVSHDLLVGRRWGMDFFNKPAVNLGKCKRVKFEENSTEIFLEFSTLLYRVAKMEQARRKGKTKRWNPTVSCAEQHQRAPNAIASNSNAGNATRPMREIHFIDLTEDTPIDLTGDDPVLSVQTQLQATPSARKRSFEIGAPEGQAPKRVCPAASYASQPHTAQPSLASGWLAHQRQLL